MFLKLYILQYNNLYILLNYSKLMERKTTSIKIEPQLWKSVKKYCIDKEVDISEYLENLIKKDLKK